MDGLCHDVAGIAEHVDLIVMWTVGERHELRFQGIEPRRIAQVENLAHLVARRDRPRARLFAFRTACNGDGGQSCSHGRLYGRPLVLHRLDADASHVVFGSELGDERDLIGTFDL